MTHASAPAVLFVDDEPQALKYFRRAFAADFSIVTARSAAEAVAVLEHGSEPIAVLVTDQRMPQGTGLDLLRLVRGKYPDVVRLLTTAYADLDDAIEAVNSGQIYAYILKPWDIQTLRRYLQEAMDLFLSRRREKEILAGKRQVMLALAGNVAHELRTPLASIRAAAAGTRRYLPLLVDVYRQAAERGEEVPLIRPSHQQALMRALESIEHEVDQANVVIDMLLANIREDFKHEDLRIVGSIARCVLDAVDRFPFQEGHREALEIDVTEDFAFLGNPTLFTYVIFNLMRNALYAISEAGGGRIQIRLMVGDDGWNRLSFRDTGTGIRAEVIPHIFNEFYSSKRSGVGNGIGLSFCKRVLTSFGGDIACRSEEGQYTEFVLAFPHVDSNKSVSEGEEHESSF